MAYTEIKEKNKKRYYYRVRSLRVGKKIGKRRIYLGVGLSKKGLRKKEGEADKELGLLENLLGKKELSELGKIKREYLKQPKENLENRYEAFCSSFTYNSTAIEGNTLTLQETSRLLFEKQVPAKSLREVNEVLNHKEAFDLILGTKEDVTKSFILKLHKILIKNTLKSELEDQIGNYRRIQVYIRGVEWLPPGPEKVKGEMRNLLLWYSRNKGKLHPLILSAYFHSAFELIHPFVDGNGRVGRIIMNFILHKNKFPMINIPNSKKDVYYKTLQEAQINGNLEPFVKFLISVLKEGKIRF